ncbi:hypothetical protein D3C76_1815080 [compost metagenome]
MLSCAASSAATAELAENARKTLMIAPSHALHILLKNTRGTAVGNAVETVRPSFMVHLR